MCIRDRDKQKSYVEVSGRKGLGVKADDLIDKLIENAQGEVALLDVSRPGTAGTWPPGTLQIPLEALREHLADLPRDKPLVVVSQTGQRGYLAWRILKQRGFSASHLDGGALSYKLTQG